MDQAHGSRRLLIEVASHFAALCAVVFALYPVLWVISLALSSGDAPEPRVLPIPETVSLANFEEVAGRTADDGTWLFGLQLFNSLFIALITSAVAIVIARRPDDMAVSIPLSFLGLSTRFSRNRWRHAR